MSNMSDRVEGIDFGQKCHDSYLALDPFRSLLVHFGMLLGVDDFLTMDAYHRGKMWLHNAWLHREGAIWGLRVTRDLEKGEIRVHRGLGLDSVGRELYLNQDACLNVSRWYQEHKEEFPDLPAAPEGAVTFDAHVVIQFKSCVARQVPALVEPCEGSGTTTAYSRVQETVELLLRPGKAPARDRPAGRLPYHRLRLLFRLEDPIREDPDDPMSAVIEADQEVLDRRAHIMGLSAEDQPAAYLNAFRYFGALDEIDLLPANTEEDEHLALFPGYGAASLVLANINGITLTPTPNGLVMTGGVVDNTVRPIHVATSTIQELLNGPLFGMGNGGPPPPPEIPDPPGIFSEAVEDDGDGGAGPDAGGPRIDPESVALEGDTITFRIAGQALKSSVSAAGFSISSFDTGSGWKSAEISSVDYDIPQKLLTVRLVNPPGGKLLRLIVRGTGEFPILGKVGDKYIPLAGQVGGPPGDEHDGHDFVYMVPLEPS